MEALIKVENVTDIKNIGNLNYSYDSELIQETGKYVNIQLQEEDSTNILFEDYFSLWNTDIDNEYAPISDIYFLNYKYRNTLWNRFKNAIVEVVFKDGVDTEELFNELVNEFYYHIDINSLHEYYFNTSIIYYDDFLEYAEHDRDFKDFIFEKDVSDVLYCIYDPYNINYDGIYKTFEDSSDLEDYVLEDLSEAFDENMLGSILDELPIDKVLDFLGVEAYLLYKEL